jgi:hypothetical protein
MPFCDVAPLANARYRIFFNEGWNACHASSASAGIPLYLAKPAYTAVNYPPLSFHLVGALSHLTGDVNLTGRWLALLSLVWVVICSAGVARKISGDRLTGPLAGLLCAAWFSLFMPHALARTSRKCSAMRC